jgi:hypothetical protein
VDLSQLRQTLATYFEAEGYEPRQSQDLDMQFSNGTENWGLALCADREEGMAYLGAFEAAMQKVIDAKQSDGGKTKFGLGIAFGSTAAGKHPSYRRALKKYSNSIVFEDLGLHILLVDESGRVIELEPSGVNLFLRDLDRWIAARAK